jgi:hypothetical protein
MECPFLGDTMKTTRVSAPGAMAALSASIIALLASVPAAHGDTTDTWSLGESGLWSVAGNWSAGVPGASNNVDITDGTSTVTLNVNASINDLTVGSGNTLVVDDGNTFTIAGPTISNKGSIQLNGGVGALGILALSDNVTLSGSGTLTLASPATGSDTAYIEEDVAGVTLTNHSTIQGAGIIGSSGLTLVNSGTIDANTSTAGGLLLNGSGGITNSGLIEATGSGTLTISGTSVANTAGNLTARGSSSVVNLVDTTVTGGTLNSISGGAIVTTNSTTLIGVTISAGSTVTTPANSITFLSGTMTNAGTIQLDGGAGSNMDLELNTNVALTGGGKVVLNTLSGGGNVVILESTGGLTLTNTNNTIQGAGLIGYGGLTVVNSPGGTISADLSGGSLVLNGSGGLTNSGTLQVSSGALLQVTNGPFTNFSGTTLTGGTYSVSGTLEIDELGTAGGEIVTDAANIILDGTAAKIVDSDSNNALTDLDAIAAKSSFTLSGDADFTTAGNFNNKGTLSVGAGSVFDVAGKHKLTNFNGGTLTLKGGTYDVAGELEFTAANIETNDAAITLTGASAEILNSTNQANGLANFAVNEATGKFVLLGASLTTPGSFSNAGIFTVGIGSTFTVGGAGGFTQTAGTTTDSGTLTASGGVNLSGGSLFASGKIVGKLVSSGIVTPAASATKTGILSDAGAYTQNSSGSLDIGIGGTTVGTTFDALKAGATVLAGTLNISQLGGFVPAVGSTFEILNFKSLTGTFTTVNGLIINGTEEYTLTYQPTDVLLTVVSTAATATEESRLTAALQEINAAYAGRNDRMAARPRLERIRAMDLVKKGAKR